MPIIGPAKCGAPGAAPKQSKHHDSVWNLCKPHPKQHFELTNTKPIRELTVSKRLLSNHRVEHFYRDSYSFLIRIIIKYPPTKNYSVVWGWVWIDVGAKKTEMSRIFTQYQPQSQTWYIHVLLHIMTRSWSCSPVPVTSAVKKKQSSIYMLWPRK